MSGRTDYTREELVAICREAIVPEQQWRNRDSASAQEQIGQAWALLSAGCEFHVETRDPQTTDRTIWVRVRAKGFGVFDWGGDYDEHLFYLPTPQRLGDFAGRDWY